MGQNKRNLKRLKVLMLIPNLDFGGAQRVFFEISNFLATKYEVHDCSFNDDEAGAFLTDQKTHSLNVSAGKNIIQKFFHFLVRCSRYGNLKRTEQIDISISHLEGANYVNVFSGGRAVKIIVEHGSKLAFDEKRRGLLGWIRKHLLMPILFRMADHIIVVSKGIEIELIEHFKISPKKITVINNSFDLSRIIALSAEALIEKYEKIFRVPTILASGRLVKEKNLFPLLDIILKIKRTTPCRLVLLGEGELKDELIKYARQIGLTVNCDEADTETNADIYFLGYQVNPFKFIARASLFVLPSTREGFPLSLCEAMICGVPVLATDCSTGPREILAPGTEGNYSLSAPARESFGILMPQLTKETLHIWSSEVLNLISNKEAGNNYRARGAERMTDFSKERIMDKWIDVIESKLK